MSYQSDCEEQIRKAEAICGEGASQAQLVGHLAGEVVRLRKALIDYVNASDWTSALERQAMDALTGPKQP